MNNIWKQIAVHPVGGLIQVGYANGSDLLLVLSHNGRGIFDCLTGEKNARDENDFFEFFDELTLIAEGFAILKGRAIKTSGLFGGSLSLKTRDGWELSGHKRNHNLNELYLYFDEIGENFLIGDDKISEIRAFGFSETEKSFVIATSSDLTIFSR